MKLFKNALFIEGMRLYFSDSRIIRTYLGYTVLLTLSVVIWWPKRSFFDFLELRSVPSTFNLTVASVYLLLVYVGSRFGLNAYGRGRTHSLTSWLNLTPLGPTAIIAGKSGLAFVHTCFFLSLAAPFLVLAASPSGVTLETAGLTLAALLLFAFTYRLIGLFLLTFLEGRALASAILYWAVILVVGLLSLYIFPRANPVLALLSLSARDTTVFAEAGMFGRDLPHASHAFRLHIILSLTALAAAWFYLAVRKRLN